MAGVHPSRQDNRRFLFDGASEELGYVPWQQTISSNVKSVLGLAWASIKTINGLAVSLIKARDGLQ